MGFAPLPRVPTSRGPSPTGPGADASLPPALLAHWQSLADTVAASGRSRAVLVRTLSTDEHGVEGVEVLVRSAGPDNPYRIGEREPRGFGLYCEHVFQTGDALHVPCALLEPQWVCSPDVARGMTAYVGFPVRGPDGRVFGTVCALDRGAKGFGEPLVSLLQDFRDRVEVGLGEFLGESLGAWDARANPSLTGAARLRVS